MFVDDLPADSGMLFIYQAQSTESYWMFNTLIPLSIAWIDRAGTIVDIQDMARLNDPSDAQEAGRTVYTPGRAVLVRARSQPGLVFRAWGGRRTADDVLPRRRLRHSAPGARLPSAAR